jgi:hypothetical protein
MPLPSYDTGALLLTEQDGTRVLGPDNWDDAVALYCEDDVKRAGSLVGYLVNFSGIEYLKRRMLRDVTLYSVDRLYRALISEGTVAVLPRIKKPGDDATPADRRLFKLSEEAFAFTKAWTDRLPITLKTILYHGTEAKFFGHKLLESEAGPLEVDAKPFKGGSYVAPIDYAPIPRTVYRFKVDRKNNVLGVVPEGAKGDENLVPATNLLVFTIDGRDNDPRGGGVSEAVWKTIRRNEKNFGNQDKASDQTGGGFVVVEEDYPREGENALQYDQNVDTGRKDADGKAITISRQRITAQAMATAKTGTSVGLLPGQRVKIVQANGADIFDAAIDRGERDIAKAYLGSAQMVNEAKRDSQSASEKAQNVGETVRDHDRGVYFGAIEREFLKWLRINFGNKYDAVVPICDIVTEESSDYAATLTAMCNPGFAALPTEIKNHAADRAGMPAVFEDADQVLPTDGQDPEQIDAEDQAKSKEEVAAFVATFLPA